MQEIPQLDPWVGENLPHSSILAWENPMDRGAWQATVCGVARVRHNLATKLLLLKLTLEKEIKYSLAEPGTRGDGGKTPQRRQH